MSTIDFSQPLATLLSESTHQAHENAEKSSGATAMISGELSKDEYIRQLMMLWYIYESVPLSTYVGSHLILLHLQCIRTSS
jgi:heme oxygenase